MSYKVCFPLTTDRDLSTLKRVFSTKASLGRKHRGDLHNFEGLIVNRSAPFQESLDRQFDMWLNTVLQLPRVKELANRITNVYNQVNLQDEGFTWKLPNYGEGDFCLKGDDLFLVFPNENRVLLPSSSREEILPQIATVLLLRELRASLIQSKAEENDTLLSYKSLTAQAAQLKASEESIPEAWESILKEVKELHDEFASSGLYKAIPWISQILSAIPPDSNTPYEAFLDHLRIDRHLTGALNEEQLCHLRETNFPEIPITFLGSPPYSPSVYHTVCTGSADASMYPLIPRGLTTVTYRGGSSRGGDSTKINEIVSADLPKYFIGSQNHSEFYGDFHGNKEEVIAALKLLQRQCNGRGQANSSLNTVILNQMIELFSVNRGENDFEETIKKILGTLTQKQHGIDFVLGVNRALYTGQVVEQVQTSKTQDVSGLVRMAELFLVQFRNCRNKHYVTKDEMSSRDILNTAGKMAGRALRLNPHDVNAQLVMARIKLIGSDFQSAHQLLTQVIESGIFPPNSEQLSELYLQRAFCMIGQEFSPKKSQPITSFLPFLAGWYPEHELTDGQQKLRELSISVRAELQKAIDGNADLLDQLRQEVQTCKESKPLISLKFNIPLEYLIILLIHEEPTNINYYNEFMKLYTRREHDLYKRHCQLAIIALLESGNNSYQEGINQTTLVNDFIENCLKNQKYKSLTDLMVKRPNYLDLYEGNTERKALLCLAVASKLKDSDRQEWIDKATQISPKLYDQLATELDKTLERIQLTEDELFQLSLLERDPEKRKKIHLVRLYSLRDNCTASKIKSFWSQLFSEYGPDEGVSLLLNLYDERSSNREMKKCMFNCIDQFLKDNQYGKNISNKLLKKCYEILISNIKDSIDPVYIYTEAFNLQFLYRRIRECYREILKIDAGNQYQKLLLEIFNEEFNLYVRKATTVCRYLLNGYLNALKELLKELKAETLLTGEQKSTILSRETEIAACQVRRQGN